MTRIKICGITNREDAIKAADLGADALGFIFFRGSRRYIDPAEAYKIIKKLPPFITTVGVFVNQSLDEISSVKQKTGIDAVQLHGDESPEFCMMIPYKLIKAVRVRTKIDRDEVELYPVQAILFDTHSEDSYGGTGRSFNWDILRNLDIPKKVILSGGLTPENVCQALEVVKPYGVDVSSGVEDSPGKKNHTKLRKFIEAVRNGY